MDCWVEPGWDQDQIWSEIFCNRKQNFFTSMPKFMGSEIRLSPTSCIPGHIDIMAYSCLCSSIACFAIFSCREEALVIVSMQWHYHNHFIFIENFGCSVGLVNVPIKNQDFLTLRSSNLCCKRDIVEKAESLVKISMCMMTWRSDYAKASFSWRLIVKNLTYSSECTVSRHFSRNKRLWTIEHR